ncbi:hypothetical protein CO652_01000 [Rhizobium sp. H4]|nr:hypothetical protein CO652_01000 [Rhizobium sp. H4]
MRDEAWTGGVVALMPAVPCGPLIRPDGHLLPAGEKGGSRPRHCFLFSPAERRWPEGSDKGARGTSSRL